MFAKPKGKFFCVCIHWNISAQDAISFFRARFVAAPELTVILNLLCQVVASSTTEKSTCSSALSCLARQSISHDIVAAEVSITKLQIVSVD